MEMEKTAGPKEVESGYVYQKRGLRLESDFEGEGRGMGVKEDDIKVGGGSVHSILHDEGQEASFTV